MIAKNKPDLFNSVESPFVPGPVGPSPFLSKRAREVGGMVCRFLSCASLFFLSSCAGMTTTAPAPAPLADLLAQNLVLLPDDHFENLPSALQKKEIIFVGETHRVGPLAEAADRLAVYLATYQPVVYALEGCYGGHVLMEAVSLGGDEEISPRLYSETVRGFNAGQPVDKKILMTALDIEHSVYNNKPDTIRFLQSLAGRSTSEAATHAINKEIAQLSAQDTFDRMNRYLKNLERLFREHIDTFSPADREEISFSLALLQASNRFYQYTADRGIARIFLTPWAWDVIRHKWFIRTIERAYRKAREREAILLCRVGAGHAALDGRSEARYFDKQYSSTKGEVAAIRLVPLYHEAHDANDVLAEGRGDVDSIVKTLLKDCEYGYLSLSELPRTARRSFTGSQYYGRNGPKYDGLLFVSIEKSSN